jgi:predicted nucleotidyltransferase
MDQTTAIDKVRRYSALVTKRFEVSRIILFGSYAQGTASPDSDIDVAIVVKQFKYGFFEAVPVLWQLRREIDSLIEPILIEEDHDPAGFMVEINKTGIEIFNVANKSDFIQQGV